MLLSLHNLELTFSGHREIDDQQILKGISLHLNKGDTVALVGESGSGKSLTAMSILRLVEESNRVHYKGNIIFKDSDILTLSKDELYKLRGSKIAMIFQEPMTSLNPVFTVGNQIMESLTLHQKMNKKEALEESVNLLERCGINNARNKLSCLPDQLSGGQRQRVMIAMALACRPEILIADEPTTALDITTQQQILDLLRDLQKEFNMSVLLITHDLHIVKKIAKHIYIMKEGEIVEHGETNTVLHSPQHPYTQHLISSTPGGEAPSKQSNTPLLKINNLNVTYSLRKPLFSFFSKQTPEPAAVKDFNLELAEGTTCGIIGESGSGKTSLAMALLQLVNFSGEVFLKDIAVHQLSGKQLREMRRNIQIVFQDPFSSLSPRLTISEILMEGLHVHKIGKNKGERRKIAARTLYEVGLSDEMLDRYPHEFSGGQRQRISIARALVLKPKLLLLDEPTSALDMTIQAQILELLKQIQQKYNMTYIFISHDIRVVRAISDYIIVMQQGKIIEQGKASTIFKSPRHIYTQQLFQAALA